MNMKLKTEISLIHSLNRPYTNILGLIDQHILKGEFSLSEVQVLHKIEKTENRTSKMLSDTPYVDMGYLSRIIWKFEKRGFVRKEQPVIGSRTYNLYITDTDGKRMTQLNNTFSSQIAHLLKPLSEIDCGSLAAHMTAVEALLIEDRNVNPQDITIRTKIHPGDIGYIAYLHGYTYQEGYGYSTVFGHYVADSFAQFIGQYQPGNNRLWYAEYHGNITGYIGIAGHNERAQLRWFLADPRCRGPGLGKRLLQEAVAFSREVGYQTLSLDMTNNLDTAIAMYQRAGSKKRGEKPNDTWRKGLLELEFEINLY